MEPPKCPKCNGEMDEGQISETVSYISNRQTGMIRAGSLVKPATACLNCGFIEIYLRDVNDLRRKIQH